MASNSPQRLDGANSDMYEYDAIYDSLKPAKKTTTEDSERKPKYMQSLMAAAAIRKRDANLFKEKKLAKDRAAEGTEFANKENFVTSGYKKQQDENKRLDEEERRKEEMEAKKNKGSGMTGFYKTLLEKREQEHAEVVKAVKDTIENGPQTEIEKDWSKSEADLEREIIEKSGGAIVVNDEGQVVDKRQLLKGGLNVAPKTKSAALETAHRGGISALHRSRGSGFTGDGRSKQAMRERQSRIVEEQLEQAQKRALAVEEDEQLKVERASKSRKTETDIISAKERYLARKREAEDARKKGEAF